MTIKDLPAAFWPAFIAMCARLGVDPFHLAAVWMNESAFYFWAHNLSGHASGLLQLMPTTARGYGFTGAKGYKEPTGAYAMAVHAESVALKTGNEVVLKEARAEKERLNDELMKSFRKLSALEQLPWAEKYYRTHAPLLTSIAAVYVCTFLPADLALAQDPNAILVARADSTIDGAPKGGRRAFVFDVNAGFDANGDRAIQVYELELAVKRACKAAGPRADAIFAAIRQALGLQPQPVANDNATPYNLATSVGVQEALAVLGFYQGNLDGQLGPQSRAAIEAFQKHWGQGLKADGWIGPLTRAALAEALAERPSPVAA